MKSHLSVQSWKQDEETRASWECGSGVGEGGIRADSAVSYFHATPNAHWRRHLRRWTRWRLRAAERGYPGTHTSAGLKLTFCRCIDDSGHHPGGQWQCGSDSEDCQKPSHGFYQKDRRVAELLQFPAVHLLLPSLGFLQIHQDVLLGFFVCPSLHIFSAGSTCTRV